MALVLKEGPAEDFANQGSDRQTAAFCFYPYRFFCADRISGRLRFPHERRAGENLLHHRRQLCGSEEQPALELLRKKGIEVLLLSDRIDEWMMNYLTEFDGKPFQSVSKVDESLEKLADEVDESAKEAEKALTPFIDRVKALLGERVKDVRLTHRLTDTPAIVSTDADEMSTQMAKLFAAAGQKVPEVKYIFELNPDHVLVKRAADTEDEAKFSEWVELLLDQALLAERGTLEDPNLFIRRMNQLLVS